MPEDGNFNVDNVRVLKVLVSRTPQFYSPWGLEIFFIWMFFQGFWSYQFNHGQGDGLPS